MNDAGKQPSPRLIASATTRVLDRNALAALATLIEAPSNVGAKLLVEESGERTGSLGDAALDEAASQYAKTFLDSRSEARTFTLKEISSEAQALPDARILFERIEPEPRLVICGAGHVGASLARLARFVGYHTTLIDDRPEFLRRERFESGSLELVRAAPWADAIREAIGSGRNVSVAIVPRGHSEDEE